MIHLPGGSVYEEEYRRALVGAVGEDGAWLLFSIDHYGWRARYDVISTLLQGSRPAHRHHARHLQSIIDLEVQSAMYASAEQLARLARAVTETASGSDFFTSFVASLAVGKLDTLDISKDTLEEALDLPSPAELSQVLAQFTDDPLTPEEARLVLQNVQDLLSEIAGNLSELGQLVKRHDLSKTDAPVDEGHSLRTVDNAYRHGLKVLFHDALPGRRSFGVAVTGKADPLSEYAIDLYQSSTEPKFATIDARPERTNAHLEALRVIAIRIRQLTRLFIATSTGKPALVATVATIDLPDPDPSLANDHS